MNSLLGFVLAVLVYPGALVGLLAAWLLTWVRQSSRAALSGGTLANPLHEVQDLRQTIDRETLAPEGLQQWVLTLGSSAALLLPLLALILLPVPGNPLVAALGLTGDIAAEGALLLGLPLARMLVGWATPSPYTRLAADRAARLLAGAIVPMVFALTTSAEQLSTLSLTDTPSQKGLTTIALIARLLALAAFALVVPALARTTTLRDGEAGGELVAGELTEVSGRDLASFRIGEAIQLVAVAGLFSAAFVLPLFPTAPAGVGRALLWLVGIVGTAAGLGAWESLAGRRRAIDDRPPLNWWLGWPLLLALVALVVAAWAARGV